MKTPSISLITAVLITSTLIQSAPVKNQARDNALLDWLESFADGDEGTSSSSGSSSNDGGFSLSSFFSNSKVKSFLSSFGFSDDDSGSSGASSNPTTTTAASPTTATGPTTAPTASTENTASFTWFTHPGKHSTTTTPAVGTSTPTTTSTSSPATTSSTSTSTTPTSSSTSDNNGGGGVTGSDKQFAQDILDAHNKYRKIHDVGDLSWDDSAYQYAQKNADNYDCSGVLTHTHGPFGENLAAGFSSGPSAVKAWYVEGESFNYQSPNTYNHFTQVVWKDSTKVGCAYKDCSAENWKLYVVCEYDPPGNVIGQEKQNVLPPNN